MLGPKYPQAERRSLAAKNEDCRFRLSVIHSHASFPQFEDFHEVQDGTTAALYEHLHRPKLVSTIQPCISVGRTGNSARIELDLSRSPGANSRSERIGTVGKTRSEIYYLTTIKYA